MRRHESSSSRSAIGRRGKANQVSGRDGLSTQVDVGTGEGLQHPSSIHCDALVSLPKAALIDYVGALSPSGMRALDAALRIALAVE